MSSYRRRIIPFLVVILLALGIQFNFIKHPKHVLQSYVSLVQSYFVAAPKKKIIIFTSNGGGGHTSVTNALSIALGNQYDVQPVFIFKDILKQLDPVRMLTLNKLNAEQLHNYLAQKKYFGVLNMEYNFGKWFFTVTGYRMRCLLKQYLQKEKPDMVISAVPLVNSSILAVVKKLQIPFIVLSTELDPTPFMYGIDDPDYEQFRLTTMFDDPVIKKKLVSAGIPKDQLVVTGLPINPEFFTWKNKQRIKQTYVIPEGKPVIQILMGSLGSSATYSFAKELAQLTTPAHLIICLGKNEGYKEKIERIHFPPHITTTIVGFTHHMPDLMAVTDLLLTKSGSVSLYEGIHMNIPMLLDATADPFIVESYNHEFLKRHKFGRSITNGKIVAILIDDLLKYPEKLQAFKYNLAAYKSNKRGDIEISKLVKRMIH